MTVLQGLIDKQDNVEIIRDQIGAILVAEVANQMALAVIAAKDPAEWDLRVFTERSNPWEQFLGATPDPTPIVNVWIDNTNYDPNASNVAQRQKTTGTYNIDIYGYGRSADNPGGGHTPGDREAAFELQRATRLVRNILMSGENTYLQMRGTVWGRWPRSISTFQPSIDNNNVANVIGARLAFEVIFNEFSPQYEAQPLEFLAVDVLRKETGELYFEADYDFTAP